MIPAKYRHLAQGSRSLTDLDAISRFIADLWDYDAAAYTFIGTRRGERWRDHPIKGSDRQAKVAAILAQNSPDQFDIYFCPNAFSQPHRRTDFALPSCLAHCDIDDADPEGYDPSPNILWETSPGRFQGIWIWRDTAEGRIAERYSHNIWRKDGGDKGGWSITKMLRAPGSINHKSCYNQPVVTLRAYRSRPQKVPPSIATTTSTRRVGSAPPVNIKGLAAGKIMRRYRRAMGLHAGSLMTAKRVLRHDRSGAVYQIVAGMISAGASDSEIAAVLLVNPYFIDKWGTDLAKAEDQIARIRTRLETVR